MRGVCQITCMTQNTSYNCNIETQMIRALTEACTLSSTFKFALEGDTLVVIILKVYKSPFVSLRFVLESHMVECSMGSFIHRDSRS